MALQSQLEMPSAELLERTGEMLLVQFSRFTQHSQPSHVCFASYEHLAQAAAIKLKRIHRQGLLTALGMPRGKYQPQGL